MMKRMGTLGPRLALAALIAVSAACGGDSVTPPPPPPTLPPAPPPPRVVSQGAGALPSEFIGRSPFTTTLPGRLDVTVNWTFDTNDLDVYLARGDCSFEQLMEGGCVVEQFSESATAKPERLTMAAAAAATYTLFIGNRGPDDESLSWQVVLTPSAGTASASVPVTVKPLRLSGLKPGRIVPVH